MSLQICPNCKMRGITWYCDDDNKDRWHCRDCRFDCSEEEYVELKKKMNQTKENHNDLH